MSSPRPLHVLIATAGRDDLLRRTLASLAGCERPAGYAGTVVVENGLRRDAECVVAEADPALRCHCLHVEEANKSAALNVALSTLDDGLVYLTDDDVRFSPATLTAYAAAAEIHPAGRFFGGPCDVEYEQAPAEWLRTYLPVSARGWEPSAGQAADDPSLWFLGFNWAANVADLLRAGGFDSAFGPGSPIGSTGQETQMQGRLKTAGLRPFFVPGARVWHQVSRECCRREWVIRRARRNGRQVGLESTVSPVMVGQVPWWVWRRMLTTGLRLAVTRLSLSRSSRLKAETRWSYNLGLIDGFRKRSGTAASVLCIPHDLPATEAPHAHRY